MAEELRPCPVCGAAKGLYVIYDEHYMEWLVFCDSCKTSLRNEHNDTRDDAISMWNRRAERTCQIVVSIDRNPASYGGRVHRCSSCGKALPGALFRNGWIQLDYCPRCGSRVTEVVRDAD